MRFEECRSRALECLRLAYQAHDVNTRAEWVNAAQQWLQRADNVHRIEMSRRDRTRRIAQDMLLQCDSEIVISWKEVRASKTIITVSAASPTRDSPG